MIDESWFGGLLTVGQLSDDEKAAYLRAVADPDAPPAADAVGEPAERLQLWFSGPKPFDHTGSMVGYIQPTGDQHYPLVDPRELGPERTLIGTKVTVRLTQALIVRYPGRGVHEVLLHFGRRGQ